MISHSKNYGGPKGSITNQFTKTQNNFPKHKSISQNTNQFTKTQNNIPKHKSVYQNTNQFLKTQTNFVETQIKRLGTCSVIIREPGKDSFPGFSASNMATSNMISRKCSGHNSGSEVLQEYFYCSQCGLGALVITSLSSGLRVSGSSSVAMTFN